MKICKSFAILESFCNFSPAFLFLCIMHNVLWVFNTATSSYKKLELRANTDAASIEDVEKWDFDGNCCKYLHILWTKNSPSVIFCPLHKPTMTTILQWQKKNSKAWSENPFNEKSNSSNWRLRELKFHLKRGIFLTSVLHLWVFRKVNWVFFKLVQVEKWKETIYERSNIVNRAKVSWQRDLKGFAFLWNWEIKKKSV